MITLALPTPSTQEHPPTPAPRRIWYVVVLPELDVAHWPEGLVLSRECILLTQQGDELPGHLWDRWTCQSHVDRARRARGLTPHLAELELLPRTRTDHPIRYLVHALDRRVSR